MNRDEESYGYHNDLYVTRSLTAKRASFRWMPRANRYQHLRLQWDSSPLTMVVKIPSEHLVGQQPSIHSFRPSEIASCCKQEKRSGRENRYGNANQSYCHEECAGRRPQHSCTFALNFPFSDRVLLSLFHSPFSPDIKSPFAPIRIDTPCTISYEQSLRAK